MIAAICDSLQTGKRGLVSLTQRDSKKQTRGNRDSSRGKDSVPRDSSDATVHAQDLAIDAGRQRQVREHLVDLVPHLLPAARKPLFALVSEPVHRVGRPVLVVACADERNDR